MILVCLCYTAGGTLFLLARATVRSCPSPSTLGMPLEAEPEQDDMIISPMMGPAHTLDAAMSPIAAPASPPPLAISPLWNPAATEDDSPGSLSPLIPNQPGDLSPICSSMLPWGDSIPAPDCLGGHLRGPHRVLPAERSDPHEQAHPAEHAHPPDYAHPPDARPRSPAGQPDDVRNAHGALHRSPGARPPQSRAVVSVPVPTIAPRPRGSEGDSSSGGGKRQEHILNSAVLLNEQSCRHLGHLRIDRAAWYSALETSRGYEMHCATLDWVNWCVYNDTIEALAEERFPDAR